MLMTYFNQQSVFNNHNSNHQSSIINHQSKAYTLVEILVVLTIIVILLLLTFPSIRAMQAASGRAEAYNTINAALQAARSYAIMHSVKTAARFQPNGKIFLVYRYDGTPKSEVEDWSNPPNSFAYPDEGTHVPNSGGYIYLPVVDQKPLILPRGYIAANKEIFPDSPPAGYIPPFAEPFYVCYNSDGTLAVNEPIFVALVDDDSNVTPVNPDFDGKGKFAWKNWPPKATYDLDDWIKYIYNERTSGNNDVEDIDDSNDRKLAKYVFVANDDSDEKTILEDQEKGPDYYAGRSGNLTANSATQIVLLKTYDKWNDLALFEDSSNPNDKRVAVKKTYYDDKQYELIYLNPYTGKVIKPVK